MTRWIVKDCLPLTTVNSPNFRAFCDTVNGNFPKMSYKNLVQRICLLEKTVRDQMVKQTEGQSIALTIDHWSSIAKQNYTGMTAHWIDDNMVLHATELGCFLHTGDSDASSLIDDCMEKLFNKCKFKDVTIVSVTR